LQESCRNEEGWAVEVSATQHYANTYNAQ